MVDPSDCTHPADKRTVANFVEVCTLCNLALYTYTPEDGKYVTPGEVGE